MYPYNTQLKYGRGLQRSVRVFLNASAGMLRVEEEELAGVISFA